MPGLACGPELNLFSIPKAYAYSDEFKTAARKRHSFEVPYPVIRRSKFFNTKYLDVVGLTTESLDQLLEASTSFPDFIQRFADNFASFRERELKAIAEKTPENLCCVKPFHQHFPHGTFIIVVRDGRAVVGSLMRRGYSLYESALVWLCCSHMAQEAAHNLSLVIQMRYEYLVTQPFARLATVVNQLGFDVSATEISERFTNNPYRANIQRVPTWRAKEYTGKTITTFSYEEDLSTEEIALLESLTLVLPDGRELGFSESLAMHDYPASGKKSNDVSGLWEQHAKAYYGESKNLDLQCGYSLIVRGSERTEKSQLNLLDQLNQKAGLKAA